MVTHLRPEWDGREVAANLHDALAVLPVAEVEVLAREAATDTSAQSPRVISWRARNHAEHRAQTERAEAAAAERRHRSCTSPSCDGNCRAHSLDGPPEWWADVRAGRLYV